MAMAAPAARPAAPAAPAAMPSGPPIALTAPPIALTAPPTAPTATEIVPTATEIVPVGGPDAQSAIAVAAEDDADEPAAEGGGKRSRKGMVFRRWTSEEEARLKQAVEDAKTSGDTGQKGLWDEVARLMGADRSASSFAQHWQIMNGKRGRPSADAGKTGIEGISIDLGEGAGGGALVIEDLD